jgi:hypothetical protein
MKPVEDGGETESRGLVVVGASAPCLFVTVFIRARSLDQQSSNLFHSPRQSQEAFKILQACAGTSSSRS